MRFDSDNDQIAAINLGSLTIGIIENELNLNLRRSNFSAADSIFIPITQKFDSFQAAKQDAINRGGRLAVFGSQNQIDNILANNDHPLTRQIKGRGNLIMGLEKINGIWKWIDGTPLTYSRWGGAGPGGQYGVLNDYSPHSFSSRSNVGIAGHGYIIEYGNVISERKPIRIVQKGDWVHLALTVQDDGFYQAYYNGEEVLSGTGLGFMYGISTNFDGAVDSLSTYDEALTPSQIKAIYDDQKPQTYFHTVTQDAFQPSIEPTQTILSSNGGTASTNLTLSGNVEWTATTETPWIEITSSATGAGSSELRILADRNPTVYERTGTVSIAGQVFTVIQSALNVDLTYDSAIFKADGGDLSIDINTEANAAWNVSTDEDWIIPVLPAGLSGTGSGSAFILIAPYNNVTSSRSGILNIAGQEVVITQRGYDLSVDPAVSEVGSNAGAGEFGVSAPITAIWEAIVTHPWITLIGSKDGQGNGTVRYSLAQNTTGAPRTGKVIVSGEEYVITQSAGISVAVSAGPNGSASGSGSYDTNEVATLTAEADEGYVFSHWTGDGVGSENPLELIIDAPKSVVANFIPEGAVEQFRRPFVDQLSQKDELIAEKETQIQGNAITITSLQAGIDALAAANVELQSEVDTVKASNVELQSEVDEKDVLIATLETTITQKDVSINDKNLTISVLEASVNNLSAQKALSDIEILEKDQQITDLTSSVATKDTLIAELEKRPTSAELALRDEQITELIASGATKDTLIAELEKRPSLDQLQDARSGSVIVSSDKDTGKLTLSFAIEESEDLINWVPVEGNLIKTIDMPEGKKFYRFVLEK